MSRNSFALLAGTVAVGAATLVPEPVSGLLVVGPVAAAAVGLVVAWSAAHAEDGSLGAGVRVSLWAGLGALVGTAVAVSILAVVLGGNPTIQEMVRMSEPHPEARLPYESIQPLAAAAGVLVGIVAGVENLVASAIGGLIGGLLGGIGAGYRSSPAR